MQIYTTKGILDTDDLYTKDIVTFENNSRITATEWYLGEELVRRDVNVNILVGLDFNNTQSNL